MHVLLDNKVRTWNKWQCAGPADHHYDTACVVVLFLSLVSRFIVFLYSIICSLVWAMGIGMCLICQHNFQNNRSIEA